MVSDLEKHFTAMDEIRDRAILLSLGNDYLCEDPILKKIGQEIDANIGRLKDDISALKKRFPGKFTREVDTDGIIEEISRTARRLKEPDKDLNEKCTVGILGQELEAHVHSLAGAIHDIRVQVEGASATFTKKDSVLRIFKGADLLVRPITILFKILIGLVVISIIPLAYLYLTMEKEEPLLKSMDQSTAYVQSQIKILSELDARKEKILNQIERLEGSPQNRQDKITVLKLGAEVNEIDSERNKVQAEISTHEKKLEEQRKKIEEIKNKSFIERLLRR